MDDSIDKGKILTALQVRTDALLRVRKADDIEEASRIAGKALTIGPGKKAIVRECVRHDNGSIQQSNQEKGPTGETYEIETVEDMINIPDHRIDAFLQALEGLLRVGSKVLGLFNAVSSNTTKSDAMKAFGWTGVMIWVDDGEHGQSIQFKNADGEMVEKFDISLEDGE